MILNAKSGNGFGLSAPKLVYEFFCFESFAPFFEFFFSNNEVVS